MTTSKSISMTQLIRMVDPEHGVESLHLPEYEFSARGQTGRSNPQTGGFEDGKRVFRANYRKRGAYTPEVVSENGLMWNGVPIDWNGQELTWDD